MILRKLTSTSNNRKIQQQQANKKQQQKLWRSKSFNCQKLYFGEGHKIVQAIAGRSLWNAHAFLVPEKDKHSKQDSFTRQS